MSVKPEHFALPKTLAAKDPTLGNTCSNFKQGISKQAEYMLTEFIPFKLHSLSKDVPISGQGGCRFANSSDTYADMPPEFHTGFSDLENRGKRRRLEGENSENFVYLREVPSNAELLESLKRLKAEAEDLLETISVVKIFILLSIPKIEDGNNFGVEIQEEIVQELSRAEDTAFSFTDSSIKYFTARAKICAKILKYPLIKDYHFALLNLDEREWTHIKLSMIACRNYYAVIFDMLNKNWQKVIKPRSEASNMVC